MRLATKGEKRKPKLSRTDPLEKDIEKKVCDYARKKGFYVRKFTSPCARAVPDRLMIPPDGEAFFVEFKRLGELPTPAQYMEHRQIRAVGGRVDVIDSVERGMRMIDGIIEWVEMKKKLAFAEPSYH